MTPIALALLFATAPADVDLRWDAPAECPSGPDVEARVAEYLEGSETSGERVRVDATIVRAQQEWRLRLQTTVDGETQVREIVDRDCVGLAESAAVLVAIAVVPALQDAIDPVASEGDVPPPPESATDSASAEPEGPAEPKTTTTTTTASTPIVAPEPAPPPAPPVHASVRAVGGASLGWLPPGGDVGLVLAITWSRLRVEATGVYSPLRRIRFDDLADAGADVVGWAVGARACGVLWPTVWLDVPLCAGVEAGQVVAAAVRLVDGRRRAAPWAAAVAAPSLRFVVHPRIALWVSPELLVTIARPEIRVRGQDAPLFRAAPVGGRFHGGIEVRFL